MFVFESVCYNSVTLVLRWSRDKNEIQLPTGIRERKEVRRPAVACAADRPPWGGYLLATTLSPALPGDLTGQVSAVSKIVSQRQPDIKVIVSMCPKIGVDVAIVKGVTDRTLAGGAWHRVPENGDPLSAATSYWPLTVFTSVYPTANSGTVTVYHIDALNNGDQSYVDYNGVRYAYEVTKRYSVARLMQIEAPSREAKLTLYSCDLRGPAAGREVVRQSLSEQLRGSMAAPNQRPYNNSKIQCGCISAPIVLSLAASCS